VIPHIPLSVGEITVNDEAGALGSHGERCCTCLRRTKREPFWRLDLLEAMVL